MEKKEIKKIDLVYSGWIGAPNGASRFVALLKQNKINFRNKHIELDVFSLDIFKKKEFSNPSKVENRNNIKSILNKISRFSSILTFLLVYIQYIRHAKKIVNYYLRYCDNKGSGIFFQDLFACYYYIRNRNKNNRQTIFLTCHDNGDLWNMFEIIYPKVKTGFIKKFFNKITMEILENVDYIGFVSDSSRNNFCSIFPSYPKEKTYFVYNGIKEKDFGYKIKNNSEDYVTFICVGTICERKNQIGIIEAISFLDQEIQKRIRIIFVGDGDMKNEIISRCNNIKSKILFTGNTNNVDDFLINSDCFILFSKDEGLPISIIEALRVGLPIIGSNVAGIPEMIKDGINGYLVNLNIKDLGNAILKIIKNKSRLLEMGNKSKLIFKEKFTLEKMIENYSNIFYKRVS